MTIWLFWSQIFLAVAPFRVLEIISDMDRSQAKREHGGIRSPPVSTAQQWTCLAHAWSPLSRMCHVEAPPTSVFGPLVVFLTLFAGSKPPNIRALCLKTRQNLSASHCLLQTSTSRMYVVLPSTTFLKIFGSWRMWIDFLLPTKAPSGSNHNLCQIPCAFFVDSYEGRTVVLFTPARRTVLLWTTKWKEVKHRCRCLEQVYQLFEKTSQDFATYPLFSHVIILQLVKRNGTLSTLGSMKQTLSEATWFSMFFLQDNQPLAT